MALIDKVVSWWEFQESAGATRNDSTATANNLTDHNTVGQGTGHVESHCADFTASSSQYLSHTSNSSLQNTNSEFCIAGWFRLKDTSNTYFLVGKDQAGGREYGLYYDSGSGHFKFEINGDVGANMQAEALVSVSANTWYYIVARFLRFNPTSAAVFIRVNNGTDYDGGAGNITPNVGSTEFRIGARSYSGFENYLNGLAEQVVIFNQNPTSGELDTLWNGGAGVDYETIAGTGLAANVATITAMTSTTLTLSGTAVTGGTANFTYTAQISTDNATWSTVGTTQSLAAAVAPSTRQATGLTPGTLYYMRWSVTDSAGSPATVTSASTMAVPHTAGHYYFDNTNGSDSNNGTASGTAWKTATKFQGFLNATVADDIASVQNTMTGSFHVVSAPGTSGHPVTINSFGTGGTIAAGNSYGFWLDECNYTTLDGLTITGATVTPGSPTTTTNTDSGVKATLNGSADLTNVNITNCTISGFGVNGIFYSVGASSSNHFVTPTISGNTVHDIVNAGITGYHLPAVTHDFVFTNPTVAGNTVYHVYGDGVGNTGYGIQAVNWNGGTVGGSFANRNYVYQCGQASAGSGGGPAGIITTESSGVTVSWNEVDRQYTNESSDGFGIDCDAGSVNCIVEHNYVHDGDGPAFVAFHIGSPFTTTTGNVFRFNVSQNNGRRSHTASIGHFATFFSDHLSTNTSIYNNTEYSTNGGVNAETKVFADNSTTGLTIRDNIFISDGAGRTFGTILTATTLNPNRYDFINSAAISGTYHGSSFASFAALQGLGGEAAGSSGDPQLTSIGTGGANITATNWGTLTAYNPLSTVSANGGANIQAYSGTDFHGNPIPFGARYPVGACVTGVGRPFHHYRQMSGGD